MAGNPPNYPPQFQYPQQYPPPPPYNQTFHQHHRPAPPHSFPNRQIRGKLMYLNPPKPSNAIFIKGLPQDLTNDEFSRLFSQFGEIASMITNHIRDRGIAFVTYYNVMSAQSAVEQVRKLVVKDKTPSIQYSFKPPNYSGIDSLKFTTFVLVQPIQNSQKVLGQDKVYHALVKFGQIHQIDQLENNQIKVQFCDLRAAKRAADEASKINIDDIECKVELYDDPPGEAVYQPITNQPPPNHFPKQRNQQYPMPPLPPPHLPQPPPPPSQQGYIQQNSQYPQMNPQQNMNYNYPPPPQYFPTTNPPQQQPPSLQAPPSQQNQNYQQQTPPTTNLGINEILAMLDKIQNHQNI